MVTEPDSSRRQPKGDKRDRTRSKLLEAARSLIREKGYEHATLEAIAERAGMTTGAIYGNFRNRDELFISWARPTGPPSSHTYNLERPSPKSCVHWPTPRSRQSRTVVRPRSVA